MLSYNLLDTLCKYVINMSNSLISSFKTILLLSSGVPTGGFNHPPPEILKALQNRAKLNPIVNTVKNC